MSLLKILTATAVFVTGLFSGAPLGLGAASAEANALRVRPDVILDRSGFGGTVPAATLFVPEGWKTEGGVAWGQQHSCTHGYGVNWTASSPDGSEGFAAIPHQGWEWNNSGASPQIGCRLMQISDAESYLRAIIQHTMPTARITRVQRRSDLEAADANLQGVKNDGFQRIERTVTAAQAFVDYELNGQRLEGSITASVLMTHIQTGGSAYGIVTESWTGYAGTGFASWAPAGQYDASLYEAIAKSYTVAPHWSQLISAHVQKMNQINLEGIMARGKIWRDAHAEISQIINDTWANQQQSADYRAREFLEAIRDVETYSDAGAPGGTVELSSFYDQAWKLEDGTYVLTSDPSFNPYQTFGVSGQQLGVAP